jgi:hypothetical protein
MFFLDFSAADMFHLEHRPDLNKFIKFITKQGIYAGTDTVVLQFCWLGKSKMASYLIYFPRKEQEKIMSTFSAFS